MNALNPMYTFNVRRTYTGENTLKRKRKDHPDINTASLGNKIFHRPVSNRAIVIPRLAGKITTILIAKNEPASSKEANVRRVLLVVSVNTTAAVVARNLETVYSPEMVSYS